MKSLFFSIFAILIIASCESSTSPDTKEEGQRIGTWMVYDTEAEWVGSGSSNKAKGATLQAERDTVQYTEPDGFSLFLYPNSVRENKLAYQFADSTISKSLHEHNVRINISSSSNYITYAGQILGWRNETLVVNSFFQSTCNNGINLPPRFYEPIPDDEILYIDVTTRDSSDADFERTIALSVAGLDSVAQGALDCD